MKFRVIARSCGYYVTELEAASVADAVARAGELPADAWSYTHAGTFGSSDLIGDIVGVTTPNGEFYDEDAIEAEIDSQTPDLTSADRK